MYGVLITRRTLSNIYKRHGVGHLKPSYKWHLGSTCTEVDYADRKRVFCTKLLGHMRARRQIVYLDETSTHMWEKRSRVWMPRANPIYLRLQQDRGQSRTVIGAICKSWPLMKYQVVDKTNAESFCAFLQ